jgi:diaminopimelate decarboxylase
MNSFNPNLVSKLKNFKTPFYYYDIDVLTKTLDAIKKVVKDKPYHVHYAMKANANEKVLKLIQSKGFGADCVSGNEVKRALSCGFSPEKIAFAGVGKTDEEIILGLESEIFTFNCESKEELEIINQLAKEKNKIAKVALRINPNVNANTHKYITTGLEENKFGINIWELESLVEIIRNLENVIVTGIHFHIGSQITDLTSFKNLCTRVNELQQFFENKKITLTHINVGGGLGINYHEPDSEAIVDFESYFKIFEDFLILRPHQELHFELGRAIAANFGTLIGKVIYVKKGVKTNFAILDAGMTELIRPALYQSYHKIENISSISEEKEKYDVVGPICESSDCFGKAVNLPLTQRGDLIAIRSAGAYGEVMSSAYNLRVQNPIVFSDEIL